MSYDIHLSLPELGSPEEQYGLDVLEDVPMDPHEKARNRKLVELLKAQTPEFDLFESPDVLELSDSTTGSGIQISLFAKTGAISMPYWHHGADAGANLVRISAYLKLLHDEGGFVAYDPQTGRVVSESTAYSLSPGVYSEGVDGLRKVLAKPWWKLW